MTGQRKGGRRPAGAGLVLLALSGALVLVAGCGGGGRTTAGATRTPTGGASTAPTVPTGQAVPTTRTRFTTPTRPAAPTAATTTTAAAANPTTAATTHPPAPAPQPVPACLPTEAATLATTAGANQLVTVVAPTLTSTDVTVTLWQRRGPCWVGAGGPWAGVIGANGFSDHHREGDDTTPTGIYPISPVSYGNAPNPGVLGTYHQLECGDWWDEDPTSPAYNTFQHVPCGTAPPFGGGSEALWTETVAYPSFAVVDYNTASVVPYAGSAIFIHANIGGPTAGCVSIPLSDLDQMLRWLEPNEQPMIAMGPAGEITRF